MRTFRINDVKCHYCRPDWSWTVVAGQLRDLDLWFIFGGHGTVVCGGETHAVSAGDVFLFRSSSVVDAEHDPSDPLAVYAVHFDRLNEAGDVMPMNDDELPPVHRRVPDPEFFEKLFMRLLDAFHAAAGSGAARSWLSAIWEEIVNADLHPHASTGKHDAAVDSICSRIRNNPERRYTVSGLAAELSISPAHFMRVFRDRTSMAPSCFIVKARIDAAKWLLRESNYSITRISELLNYADVYFFSRQFKQIAGLTPTQYRNAG